MIDWIKRAWRGLAGPIMARGEDQFGFVPVTGGPVLTPGGRARIGHQKETASGLYFPVYADGSGRVECFSPAAFNLSLVALSLQIVHLEKRRARAAEQKKASKHFDTMRQRLSDQRCRIERMRYIPTGFVLSTHAKLEMETTPEGLTRIELDGNREARMAIGGDV